MQKRGDFMATFTKEELESARGIYDSLKEHLRAKAKDTATFRKIQREIAHILDKNSNVLQTNIVGRQLLINQKDETAILDALDVSPNDVKKLIKESLYFQKFGELRLTDQLSFAIPLLIMSIEYKRLKKNDEAEILYFLTFLKPYASRVSQHWKLGVNEAQMMYTVESLSDRFDIKKQGTLFGVLLKASKNSFENYIPDLMSRDHVFDSELHIIYNSGVASRVNSFLASIYNVYKENAGKRLDFEDTSYSSVNDDGDAEQVNKEIESVAAVKTNLVRRVVNRLNLDPIDSKLIAIATQKAYKDSSVLYQNTLKAAVAEISDKMHTVLPDFYSALFGVFFDSINPATGRKFTSKDIKTVLFIKITDEIFRKPNTNDENILKVKSLTHEMLTACSDVYRKYQHVQQAKMKNALFYYFVFLARKGD